MTAEIAVLNKTAVALAADSAVTITGGGQPLKIFESADKLFELSESQPIGIMIYNGMHFLGIPLEPIIKGFRSRVQTYETVQEAANDFLLHLYEFVDKAPEKELYSSIFGVISPVVQEINSEIKDAITDLIDNLLKDGTDIEATGKPLADLVSKRTSEVIDKFEGIAASLPEAEFIERPDRKAQPARYKKFVRSAIDEVAPELDETTKDRIVEICRSVLRSNYVSTARTGLVFAGFGEKEHFPTLISYEIDGLFEAKIRSVLTESCDIDRTGVRALVRPFAQKEMVDRFLHGLDGNMQEEIAKFCAESIGEISSGIIRSLEIDDSPTLDKLTELSRQAEEAFLRNLNDRAFKSFQHVSRREIEDMVEFMPKPELARMAEALIDLTSIKRKVSQGLETVGGPVDVAVISKYDGFVWVKRKHYFSKELNARYFERSKQGHKTLTTGEGTKDGYET